MAERRRVFAIVRGKPDALDDAPVKHFVGVPPQFSDGEDLRERLPWPKVLVLEEEPDGWFLYRYASDGTAAGDTWHSSRADVQAQIEFEFDELVSEWFEIPDSETNAARFALTQSLHFEYGAD
jgi:hypothetical protein